MLDLPFPSSWDQTLAHLSPIGYHSGSNAGRGERGVQTVERAYSTSHCQHSTINKKFGAL